MHHRLLCRAAIALLAAFSGVAALPAAGQAGEVIHSAGPSAGLGRSWLSYMADAGEVNDVHVAVHVDSVTITDTGAAVSASSYGLGNCVQISPDAVRCPGTPNVQLHLSDGDDRAQVDADVDRDGNVQRLLEQDGGPGADVLVGSDRRDMLKGGEGDDTLLGKAGDDTLTDGDLPWDFWAGFSDVDPTPPGSWGSNRMEGGDGADQVQGGPNADVLLGGAGDDRLDGGLGRDLVDGGPGYDGVDWVDSGSADTPGREHGPTARGVTVRLPEPGTNTTGNGADGEDDTLRDLEGSGGTTAADVLLGSSGDNGLDGGGGNDVIDGLAGDDNVLGGSGDDRLAGGAGSDRIYGDPTGMAGDGSRAAGVDTFSGGPGIDDISAADSLAEDIDCGPSSEHDELGSDQSDRLTGCEGAFQRGGSPWRGYPWERCPLGVPGPCPRGAGQPEEPASAWPAPQSAPASAPAVTPPSSTSPSATAPAAPAKPLAPSGRAPRAAALATAPTSVRRASLARLGLSVAVRPIASRRTTATITVTRAASGRSRRVARGTRHITARTAVRLHPTSAGLRGVRRGSRLRVQVRLTHGRTVRVIMLSVRVR